MIILNFITDANGNTDWFAIIISIAVLVIVFFVSREINSWYWRLNDSIKNQEEQIRLLKKIAGEKETEDDKSTENINKIFLIVVMCCSTISSYAQTIDGGNGYSIMLCSDSTVWAVGYNGIGLLGDSTTIDKFVPVQTLGLVNITSVTTGYIHSLALKNDGTVWAWGANSFGQLGNGQTSLRIAPIQTGLTNTIAISTGLEHSLGLKSNGTVWTWGKNGKGQLGDGTGILPFSSTPIQVVGLGGSGFLTDIIYISGGEKHSLALKNDSTVWVWGWNGTGQLGINTTVGKNTPVKVLGLGGTNFLDNIIAISGGSGHSLALKSDGTVWAWGYNNKGQLGDSTTATRLTPVKTYSLTNIVAIAAGDDYSMALRNDGTIWMWGTNGIGQLGDGTITTKIIPIQVLSLSNIIAIATGYDFNLAMRDDNTFWAWGKNNFGQLGNGTMIDRLIPIQMIATSAFIPDAISICEGESINFTNTTIGATSYNWQENGITFSTAIDTLRIFNLVGTYTISLIAYSESCNGNNLSDTSSIIITVNPLITMDLGNVTVCSEDSILIFGTYQQLASTYYDSLTTPNGCDSIIQITLTVNPLPTVSFAGLDSLYCVNSSADTLTGSPLGGVFTGTTGGVFDPLLTGTFAITYSYVDANGCTATQSQDVTVISCTGIENIRFNDFKIYPNPSTGIINIQTDKQIQISNTLGRVIYNGNDNQIDLSEYGKGVYFVKVGAVIKKLVITNP